MDNEQGNEYQDTEQLTSNEPNHDYDLIRAYADQLNGEVDGSEE